MALRLVMARRTAMFVGQRKNNLDAWRSSDHPLACGAARRTVKRPGDHMIAGAQFFLVVKWF
jgi:hypothetical protein